MFKLPLTILISVFVCAQLYGESNEPVNGTMGAPLGGIGAGAVKFCSHNGNFYKCFNQPVIEDDFPVQTNTQLQFYSKRGASVVTKAKLSAVSVNGRYDDDAVFPVQTANFGSMNGCDVRLTAFAPFDLVNSDRMTYPFAFYEIEVTNTQTTAVEAACGLQLSYGTQVADAGKGIRSTDAVAVAVYAKGSDAAATTSMGGDNGFFTGGTCNNTVNGGTNRVAVKFVLAPNEKKTAKFVYAWYNGSDAAFYNYSNTFAGVAAVADFGLTHFDEYRTNAVGFSTRWFASSLPRWLKSYMTNLLSTFVLNTIYVKDGRFAIWEGWTFPITGTMDQSWHSHYALTQLAPALCSKTMEYWARTQKSSPLGQIHHDFANDGTGGRTNIVAWDDRQHGDYAGVDGWVDLNCGFIISLWELFCATGDQQKIDYFWPYMKLAGRRIIAQSKQYAAPGYPYLFQGSESTYDVGGNSNIYNAGLAAVAYRIMQILAQRQGEPVACVDTYRVAFETVNSSYSQRYLSNNFPQPEIYEEKSMAGQWMSYFLKFGELYPAANTEYGIGTIAARIDADTNGYSGQYNWPPYLMTHFGGLMLNGGRADDWYKTQYFGYRSHYSDRERVYNQTFVWFDIVNNNPAANATSGLSYCSVPGSMRNYFSLIGYHRNKMTGELWLEPTLPPQIGHAMTNALYFSPEGLGTISYEESGAGYQKQDILFRPDNPIDVTAIYVRDKGLATTVVSINGTQSPFERIGTGHAKELKIALNGTVPSSGIRIHVSDEQVNTIGAAPRLPEIRNTVSYSRAHHALIFHGPRPVSVLMVRSDGSAAFRAEAPPGKAEIAVPLGLKGWYCAVVSTAGPEKWTRTMLIE